MSVEEVTEAGAQFAVTLVAGIVAVGGIVFGFLKVGKGKGAPLGYVTRGELQEILDHSLEPLRADIKQLYDRSYSEAIQAAFDRGKQEGMNR